MVRTALIASAVAQASTIPPDQWVFVNRDELGNVYYMREADLVNSTNRNPEVWIKTDFSANRQVRFRRAMTLYWFNCDRRTVTTASEILYYPDGRNINVPHYSDTAPVAPETNAEIWLRRACPLQ